MASTSEVDPIVPPPPPTAGGEEEEQPPVETDWQVQRDQEKGFGDNAFRARDFDTAIHHYTAALSLDPEHHVLLSNRSAAYLSSHQKSKALHDAQACVEHAPPDYFKGYSRLAAALQSLGRHQQAKEAWEKVLQMDPQNAAAQKGLSVSLEILKAQKAKEEEEEEEDNDDNDKQKTDSNSNKNKTTTNNDGGCGGGEESDDLDDFFNEVEEVTEEVKKAKEEEAAEVPKATNAIKTHKKDLGTPASQVERLLQPNYQWRNLNPYYVLQIPPDATEGDISRRYKALSLMLHPDKNRNLDKAEEAWDEVQKAKRMLLDDEHKAKHCRDLAEEGMRQGKKEWEKGGKKEPLDELQFKAIMKIFAEVEYKRRDFEKRQRAQEQRERQQEEEEMQKEQHTHKFDKQWREEGRVDKRVGNWRDFQKKKQPKTDN